MALTKTITSAVLNLVTAYDRGTNTAAKAPYAVLNLNDLTLYGFSTLGALPLFGAYSKFELVDVGGDPQPVFWPTNSSYSKATYALPLFPVPDQAKSGGGPYTYIPDSTERTQAYDDTSLAALLETLVVSALAYSAEAVHAGAVDGLSTVSLKVYAAYIDITFDDLSTQRYWASGTTALPGGKFANGAGSAPGIPSDVLDADLAVDEDAATFATIEETNKIVGLTGFSALWNPAKLVLDWRLHALCGDPPDGSVGAPYTHQFIAKGGTPPYSWGVTGGEFPPGLILPPDGLATGTPTKEGTFSFTLTVTEAGSTAVLYDAAQAGTAGMSMPALTPGASLEAAASTAVYMGVNNLNEPFFAIAVAVAPPSPAAEGVDSYIVTVQGSGSEKDFFPVSLPAPETIMAQTLLGAYGDANVTFRVYAVAADGTRTLSTAWSGGSSQVITIGTAPAPTDTMGTMPPGGAGTSSSTIQAQASDAVYMGLNSLSQPYWSIAVVVRPTEPAAWMTGLVVTACNTNAGGTPGGGGATETDFMWIPVPASDPQIAQNLTGTYQTDPASTYDAITFKLYSINADGTRTLLASSWGTTDHQTVVYGAAPEAGTAPAVLPPLMTASVVCSITIGEGVLSASCGDPGIVTIGQPFSFRPVVKFGDVTLDLSYDQDGTLNWDVSGLPPGLVWDTTTGSATFGTIAGIATQPGTYAYTATITTRGGQTAAITCSLQVEGAGFSDACGTPPVAAQWLPYSFAPPFALDTDYTAWTFSGLPPGLAWDTVAGKIAGTPSELGAFVYTAVLGDTSFTCSIAVAPQGDSGTANCGLPAPLTVGLPFSFIPPFASQAPVTAWTFTGLPPGLGWDTDPTSPTYGHIAGIPSAPGGYAYHADAGTLHFTCSFIVKLPGDPGDGANDGGGKGYCWWLDLWVWEPVFAFEHLNIQVQMPYAYERALRYTLARELAGFYGRDPSIVAALAQEAVTEMDALNVSNAAGTEDPPQPPVVVK